MLGGPLLGDTRALDMIARIVGPWFGAGLLSRHAVEINVTFLERAFRTPDFFVLVVVIPIRSWHLGQGWPRLGRRLRFSLDSGFAFPGRRSTQFGNGFAPRPAATTTPPPTAAAAGTLIVAARRHSSACFGPQ